MKSLLLTLRENGGITQGAIEFDNSVEIIHGAIAKLEQTDPRLGMLAKALHKASRR